MSTAQCNFIETTRLNIGDIETRERLELMKIIEEFKFCFAESTGDLGCTDYGRMTIRTINDVPIYHKPYRLSFAERKIVQGKVQDLLANGIIQESDSDYASPVILVKKKTEDYRLCVDYRALNVVTVKDRFPLPHIDDQLCKLSDKIYFTSLDLAQGYHQVSMDEESIRKTAFVTPEGQYEYVRMGYGLANAPSVFMRIIKKALAGMTVDSILVYMDEAR